MMTRSEVQDEAEVVTVAPSVGSGPDDACEMEDHDHGDEGDDDGEAEHGGPVDGGHRFLIGGGVVIPGV